MWSEWIIGETWRVLTWRWMARSGKRDVAEWNALTDSANQMMRYLISVMTLVSLRGHAVPAPWVQLSDPNDVPVWDTAVAAGADYVISHNLSDFPRIADGRHIHLGIEYLTAVEFIEDVMGDDASELAGRVIPSNGLIRSQRAR